jgi:hypothetical protein
MALQVGKYGDLPLLITRHTDDDGRDWAVQSPARGDQHVLQERGRRLQRTSCEILFCDEPGAESYDVRFLRFLELTRDTRPRLFVHPVLGSYLAIAMDVQHTVEGTRRAVVVSCSFVAQEPPQAVFPVGAGVTAQAGPEQVGVLAAEANGHIEDLELESDAPDNALATVTAWAELEDPDARAIALACASTAAEIDEAIETLELASSLERWELYRSLVNLRYSVVRAAAAVTSETAQVTEITLTAAEPLRSICARIFGAREAEERARQVAKLNGLRTPGLVPVGTVLKLPAVSR